MHDELNEVVKLISKSIGTNTHTSMLERQTFKPSSVKAAKHFDTPP